MGKSNGKREEFGARTAPEARRTAHRIVAGLIASYFDVGQPETDGMDKEVPETDVRRLRAALERIQVQHDERTMPWRGRFS